MLLKFALLMFIWIHFHLVQFEDVERIFGNVCHLFTHFLHILAVSVFQKRTRRWADRCLFNGESMSKALKYITGRSLL